MRGRWNEELVFTAAARQILKLQLLHPLCNNAAHLSRSELEQLVHVRPIVEGRPCNNGLGSDLHTWTAMLCHAVSRGGMLVLDPRHHWVWSRAAETAELGGYFAPTHCNVSLDAITSAAASASLAVSAKDLVEPLYHVRDVLPLQSCLPPWDLPLTTSEWRAAAVEFLFRRLSSELHHKVCQAFDQVFGPLGGVPRDRLITIHMRWGDKYKEMALQSEQKYLDAVERIMRDHSMREPYLFMMTEDRSALEAVRNAVAKRGLNCTVLLYEAAVTTSGPHKMDFTPEAAEASLIALILSLEANFFIGTTGSNWSRLMNELRLNRVHGLCGGECTEFIDLKAGEWRKQRRR